MGHDDLYLHAAQAVPPLGDAHLDPVATIEHLDAVHPGHLLAGDLDDEVVDLQPVAGGEQVLETLLLDEAPDPEDTAAVYFLATTDVAITGLGFV